MTSFSQANNVSQVNRHDSGSTAGLNNTSHLSYSMSEAPSVRL